MRVSLFLILSAIASISTAQRLTSGGKLKPEQAVMDVRHYTISLDVDTVQKAISGYTSIDIILAQPTSVLLFDLMNELQVQQILVNNKETIFTHVNSLITITPAAALPIGKTTVKILYAGKPHIAARPPWEDGFTWTHDSLGHSFIAITSEGTGGKIYFPCKDHPSDEPNEGVDMHITVPSNLVVAGPGLLQSIQKKGNKTTYFWKTNYSINNYSIIFNVGDYKVVEKKYTTVEDNTVLMQFYVLSYHEKFAAHHLEILEAMAKVKEKYFGEYPWQKEKIGIVETPHLGMEQQSMNAYGNHFKYNKIGGKDFDGLMNHEFGHEWWGNKVTAKDWADYWIHEGIGSFGDELYIRDLEGEEAYIKNFKNSVFGIENKIPVVQGKDLDEEAAYIGDIYVKGSFFMHTLRYVMGDSLFFPALKELATAPQYTYNNFVSTDDVEQLFSKASHTNLKPLFDFYLRTNQKLEIKVVGTSPGEFKISLENLNMLLPLDIATDKGRQSVVVGKKAITIKSSILPIIDPDVYYLKRVICE